MLYDCSICGSVRHDTMECPDRVGTGDLSVFDFFKEVDTFRRLINTGKFWRGSVVDREREVMALTRTWLHTSGPFDEMKIGHAMYMSAMRHYEAKMEAKRRRFSWLRKYA